MAGSMYFDRTGMDLIGGNGPADAVAGIDPHLVRQKCHSLPRLVPALRAHYAIPLLASSVVALNTATRITVITGIVFFFELLL
jgi:hypothetical protein